MKFPKLSFQKFSVSENLDNLVWYAKPENSKNTPLSFYHLTLKLFPELEGKLRENMCDEEVYMILCREVKPTLERLYTSSLDPSLFQTCFDKIGNAIMKDLSLKLDMDWDTHDITCLLGLLPVCPRDIFSKTFVINYGIREDDMIAATIHELCHFLYFEKWKQIYPDYKDEEFDFPHIAWYLSEAMIDPLINNDTFHKYTSADLSAYTVFYETYIDGKSIIDTLRDYVSSFPIDDAICKGYEFFQAHEMEIKGTL